jgi:hypothetical protein
MALFKKNMFLAALLCVAILSFFGIRHWTHTFITDMGLQEVANGDAQFWLMQSAPSNRLIPCVVYYDFDSPLDEALVRARLMDLAAS